MDINNEERGMTIEFIIQWSCDGTSIQAPVKGKVDIGIPYCLSLCPSLARDYDNL